MHEMLGWRAIKTDGDAKPQPSENPWGLISSELEETAEFLRNPPQAILIPDCYIENDPWKAVAFMRIRSSLGAAVFHSALYTNFEDRPVMLTFAGIHASGESAGSEKIAGLLLDREVPPEKLIALTTTITGIGDTTQLHAIQKTLHLKGPLAVITSDGYAPRARQDLINHKRTHGDFAKTQVYILHPSHRITDQLFLANDINAKTRMRISDDIYLGTSGQYKHGPTEGLAWALSAIVVLRPLQQRAEEAAHKDIRHKEQSRYVADKMKKAADKLRFYRQMLITAGHPYRSKEKGKIEPDEDSAMKLAPGLYTRTADRGGPKDKEIKIQALTAKLPRFPDMPGHG